jgi:hypothetical protein
MIHSCQQARKLFLTLICLELLCVVVYATDAWVQGATQQLHSLIDLDGEGNLPAWFSSFQLTLIAIGFWTLAARFRETERPSRHFLSTCAGFFLLLSIDESALLHERITESLGSRYVDWLPAYLGDHPGEAVVCALILVACLAAAYPHLNGLWRYPPEQVSLGRLVVRYTCSEPQGSRASVTRCSAVERRYNFTESRLQPKSSLRCQAEV